GEVAFVDTNVLLSATDSARPDHGAARAVFEKSIGAGVHLAVSAQIIREYLVVATRPAAANGLGMRPANAVRNADIFQQRTILLEETEAVADRLRVLVEHNSLKGTRIHDANVCAVMVVHGISRLVTQNVSDFTPFAEVHALSPEAFGAELPV
ncbi:MAG: PIN domain-containing protein, partial [Spirochaetes bacterium]|nr:PIN domain-containing protein [Spirochaetota bacterium]